MDPQTLQRRAELARRLKAGRWLAGGVRTAADGKGKAGWEVYALEAKDLAARPGMAENQITASKIGSIERMERHTPPMEIAVIARCLGVTSGWLSGSSDADDALTPAATHAVLAQLLADYDLASGQGQPETQTRPGDTDRPRAGGEAGGA